MTPNPNDLTRPNALAPAADPGPEATADRETLPALSFLSPPVTVFQVGQDDAIHFMGAQLPHGDRWTRARDPSGSGL